MHQPRGEGAHHGLAPRAGRTRALRRGSPAPAQPHARPADRLLPSQVRSGGKSVPIKAVLTSLPVWAISLSCFAYSWTNHIMFLYLPTFISYRLRVDVREVSVPSVPFPPQGGPCSWLSLRRPRFQLSPAPHCVAGAPPGDALFPALTAPPSPRTKGADTASDTVTPTHTRFPQVPRLPSLCGAPCVTQGSTASVPKGPGILPRGSLARGPGRVAQLVRASSQKGPGFRFNFPPSGHQ